MAKTISLRNVSAMALMRRKKVLLRNLSLPADAIRASLVRQFLTCGKKNCRCRRGMKHGPFHYLVQCVGVGKTRKFLLKTPAQRETARKCIMSYRVFQRQAEELSHINTELLWRNALPPEILS